MRILAVVIVIVAVYQIGKILTQYLRRKAIERSIMTAAENMGILAVTPEQKIEHNLKVLKGDPRSYQAYLRNLIFSTLDGDGPRSEHVELLKQIGCLVPVNEDGRLLYPDAQYELSDTTWVKVFFRGDLTLAGTKDYSLEINKTVLESLEQKQLSSSRLNLLRKTKRIFEVPKWGEHYGGIGFPYPDERYQVRGEINGDRVQLTFDINFNLLVAMKQNIGQRNEIIWERSGARQPELYQSQS